MNVKLFFSSRLLWYWIHIEFLARPCSVLPEPNRRSVGLYLAQCCQLMWPRRIFVPSLKSSSKWGQTARNPNSWQRHHSSIRGTLPPPHRLCRCIRAIWCSWAVKVIPNERTTPWLNIYAMILFFIFFKDNDSQATQLNTNSPDWLARAPHRFGSPELRRIFLSCTDRNVLVFCLYPSRLGSGLASLCCCCSGSSAPLSLNAERGRWVLPFSPPPPSAPVWMSLTLLFEMLWSLEDLSYEPAPERPGVGLLFQASNEVAGWHAGSLLAWILLYCLANRMRGRGESKQAAIPSLTLVEQKMSHASSQSSQVIGLLSFTWRSEAPLCLIERN